MKKIVLVFLSLILVFQMSACAAKKQVKDNAAGQAKPKVNYSKDLKAVWVSYYEIGSVFLGLNEKQAKQALDNMFAALSEAGINTVFFHVRAFCDAFYPSKIFPLSENCPEGYDLLANAIAYAHRYKLSFHAWVNPYRVALGKEISALDTASPAVELYKDNPNHLIFSGKDIFLNPADKKAQRLILSGIREIVEQYDVDGIHFDDYFYPSDNSEMDKSTYAAYKNNGGSLELSDFRRESVNTLISAVHALVKGENTNLLFGVSPQCFVEKNKESLFADIASWLDTGSVDYLLPQIYFGFENESAPFEKCVAEWVSLMKGREIPWYAGLALYKSGTEDTYASEDTENKDSAYYEWMNHNDIIARQITYLKENGIPGFSLYSYSSFVDSGDNDTLAQEVNHIKNVINGHS